MIFIVWPLLCIGIAIWASNMERSGVLWFFTSLLLSPVIAGLLLLMLGKEGKKCPTCAETVKSEALKCRHCEHEFEIAKVPENQEQEIVW